MRWISVVCTPQPQRSGQASLDLQAILNIGKGFTPHVSVLKARHGFAGRPVEAVMLEVSTCFRLWGGEDSLCQQWWERIVEAIPNSLDCTADPLEAGLRMATAPKAMAAYWLALHTPAQDQADWMAQWTCAEHAVQKRLQNLPVHVLDLPTHTHNLLMQCGLYRLEQLQHMPRSGLGQRFGQDLLRQLDEGLGTQAPVLPMHAESDSFTASVDLPFHATRQDLLEQACAVVLEELAQWLQQRQWLAEWIELDFVQSHSRQTLRLGSAQGLQQASAWQQLLHHQLNRTQFESDVRSIQLRCGRTRHAVDTTGSLFASAQQQDQNWSQVCDTLKARLGDACVTQVKREADPRPEVQLQAHAPRKSHGAGSAHTVKNKHAQAPVAHVNLPSLAMRPLGLLPQAVRLTGAPPSWQGLGEWKLLSGPERIDFGWWSDTPCTRDYYRAINRSMSQAWLYCEPQQQHTRTVMQWYLHGYFV